MNTGCEVSRQQDTQDITGTNEGGTVREKGECDMQVIKEKKGVTDQQSCFIENMLKTSGILGPNMKAQQQNGNKKQGECFELSCH